MVIEKETTLSGNLRKSWGLKNIQYLLSNLVCNTILWIISLYTEHKNLYAIPFYCKIALAAYTF